APEGPALWLPTLRKGRGDWEQLLETLGTLYTRGVAVDWAGFDRDYPRAKLSVPTYPFQRSRCWPDSLRKPATPAAPAAEGSWRDWLYEPRWRPRRDTKSSDSSAKHLLPPARIAESIRPLAEALSDAFGAGAYRN